MACCGYIGTLQSIAVLIWAKGSNLDTITEDDGFSMSEKLSNISIATA